MAANASDYLENKLVDHSLGTTTFTKPTNVYLALYTSNPGEANTGTEVTGGSYVRKVVTFAAASGGVAASNADVNFTGMPAATVTHVAIFDAVSSGNMLFYGAANASQTVTAGNILAVPAGSLTVTCT